MKDNSTHTRNNLGKFHLFIRVVSLILLISFISYDVAWAYPDKLQIQLRTKKESFKRVFADKYKAAAEAKSGAILRRDTLQASFTADRQSTSVSTSVNGILNKLRILLTRRKRQEPQRQPERAPERQPKEPNREPRSEPQPKEPKRTPEPVPEQVPVPVRASASGASSSPAKRLIHLISKPLRESPEVEKDYSTLARDVVTTINNLVKEQSVSLDNVMAGLKIQKNWKRILKKHPEFQKEELKKDIQLLLILTHVLNPNACISALQFLELSEFTWDFHTLYNIIGLLSYPKASDELLVNLKQVVEICPQVDIEYFVSAINQGVRAEENPLGWHYFDGDDLSGRIEAKGLTNELRHLLFLHSQGYRIIQGSFRISDYAEFDGIVEKDGKAYITETTTILPTDSWLKEKPKYQSYFTDNLQMKLVKKFDDLIYYRYKNMPIINSKLQEKGVGPLSGIIFVLHRPQSAETKQQIMDFIDSHEITDLGTMGMGPYNLTPYHYRQRSTKIESILYFVDYPTDYRLPKEVIAQREERIVNVRHADGSITRYYTYFSELMEEIEKLHRSREKTSFGDRAEKVEKGSESILPSDEDTQRQDERSSASGAAQDKKTLDPYDEAIGLEAAIAKQKRFLQILEMNNFISTRDRTEALGFECYEAVDGTLVVLYGDLLTSCFKTLLSGKKNTATTALKLNSLIGNTGKVEILGLTIDQTSAFLNGTKSFLAEELEPDTLRDLFERLVSEPLKEIRIGEGFKDYFVVNTEDNPDLLYERLREFSERKVVEVYKEVLAGRIRKLPNGIISRGGITIEANRRYALYIIRYLCENILIRKGEDIIGLYRRLIKEITKEPFHDYGLARMLSMVYGDSASAAMIDLFKSHPDPKIREEFKGVRPYHFSSVPQGYWQGEEGARHARQATGELLSLIYQQEGSGGLMRWLSRSKGLFNKKTTLYGNRLTGMVGQRFNGSPTDALSTFFNGLTDEESLVLFEQPANEVRGKALSHIRAKGSANGAIPESATLRHQADRVSPSRMAPESATEGRQSASGTEEFDNDLSDTPDVGRKGGSYSQRPIDPKKSKTISNRGLTRMEFLRGAAAAIAVSLPIFGAASKAADAAAALAGQPKPKGTASYAKGLARVIQIDPRVSELGLDVVTTGRIGKGESLSSILKHADTDTSEAVAGINASFFIMRFPWKYHPLGLLIGKGADGEPKIYKYDGFDRVAFAEAKDPDTSKREFFIGKPGFIPYLELTGGSKDRKVMINEINAPWRNGYRNHIVAYNDYFRKVPAVNDGSLRIRIKKDGSIKVVQKGDSDIISEDEWVVIVSRRDSRDSAAKYVPALLEDGITARVISEFSGKLHGKNIVTAVMGGPRLLGNGAIEVDKSLKSADVNGVRGLKPRTGIGITWSGKIILVTVKKPIMLHHFANIMKGLGARDALNLDGGGSVARVWRLSHVEKLEGRLLPGGMVVTWERIPWKRKENTVPPDWHELLFGPQKSFMEQFFPQSPKQQKPAPSGLEDIFFGPGAMHMLEPAQTALEEGRFEDAIFEAKNVLEIDDISEETRTSAEEIMRRAKEELAAASNSVPKTSSSRTPVSYESLVGGRANLEYLNRMLQVVNPEDGIKKDKTAFYAGSGADISTAMLATGAKYYIFVDKLPFLPKTGLTPDKSVFILGAYLQQKARSSYASGPNLREMNGIWPFLEKELEVIGAENVRIQQDAESENVFIIDFEYGGIERQIVFVGDTDGKNAERYTRYIDRFGGLDFYIIKSSEFIYKSNIDSLAAESNGLLEENISKFMNPGGYLILDSATLLPRPAVLSFFEKIKDPDLGILEKEGAAFGYHLNKTCRGAYIFKKIRAPASGRATLAIRGRALGDLIAANKDAYSNTGIPEDMRVSHFFVLLSELMSYEAMKHRMGELMYEDITAGLFMADNESIGKFLGELAIKGDVPRSIRAISSACKSQIVDRFDAQREAELFSRGELGRIEKLKGMISKEPFTGLIAHERERLDLIINTVSGGVGDHTITDVITAMSALPFITTMISCSAVPDDHEIIKFDPQSGVGFYKQHAGVICFKGDLEDRRLDRFINLVLTSIGGVKVEPAPDPFGVTKGMFNLEIEVPPELVKKTVSQLRDKAGLKDYNDYLKNKWQEVLEAVSDFTVYGGSFLRAQTPVRRSSSGDSMLNSKGGSGVSPEKQAQATKLLQPILETCQTVWRYNYNSAFSDILILTRNQRLRQAQNIVDRITEANGLDHMQVRVFLTGPSIIWEYKGKIYLLWSLLGKDDKGRIYLDKEEMATAIAHEIAHTVCGHEAKVEPLYKRWKEERRKIKHGRRSRFAELTARVRLNELLQENEFEADLASVILMHNAMKDNPHFNPGAILDVYIKGAAIDSIFDRRTYEIYKELDTHPDDSARIANLRYFIEKRIYANLTLSDFVGSGAVPQKGAPSPVKDLLRDGEYSYYRASAPVRRSSSGDYMSNSEGGSGAEEEEPGRHIEEIKPERREETAHRPWMKGALRYFISMLKWGSGEGEIAPSELSEIPNEEVKIVLSLIKNRNIVPLAEALGKRNELFMTQVSDSLRGTYLDLNKVKAFLEKNVFVIQDTHGMTDPMIDSLVRLGSISIPEYSIRGAKHPGMIVILYDLIANNIVQIKDMEKRASAIQALWALVLSDFLCLEHKMSRNKCDENAVEIAGIRRADLTHFRSPKILKSASEFIPRVERLGDVMYMTALKPVCYFSDTHGNVSVLRQVLKFAKNRGVMMDCGDLINGDAAAPASLETMNEFFRAAGQEQEELFHVMTGSRPLSVITGGTAQDLWVFRTIFDSNPINNLVSVEARHMESLEEPSILERYRQAYPEIVFIDNMEVGVRHNIRYPTVHVKGKPFELNSKEASVFPPHFDRAMIKDENTIKTLDDLFLFRSRGRRSSKLWVVGHCHPEKPLLFVNTRENKWRVKVLTERRAVKIEDKAVLILPALKDAYKTVYMPFTAHRSGELVVWCEKFRIKPKKHLSGYARQIKLSYRKGYLSEEQEERAIRLIGQNSATFEMMRKYGKKDQIKKSMLRSFVEAVLWEDLYEKRGKREIEGLISDCVQKVAPKDGGTIDLETLVNVVASALGKNVTQTDIPPKGDRQSAPVRRSSSGDSISNSEGGSGVAPEGPSPEAESAEDRFEEEFLGSSVSRKTIARTEDLNVSAKTRIFLEKMLKNKNFADRECLEETLLRLKTAQRRLKELKQEKFAKILILEFEGFIEDMLLILEDIWIFKFGNSEESSLYDSVSQIFDISIPREEVLRIDVDFIGKGGFESAYLVDLHKKGKVYDLAAKMPDSDMDSLNPEFGRLARQYKRRLSERYSRNRFPYPRMVKQGSQEGRLRYEEFGHGQRLDDFLLQNIVRRQKGLTKKQKLLVIRNVLAGHFDIILKEGGEGSDLTAGLKLNDVRVAPLTASQLRDLKEDGVPYRDVIFMDMEQQTMPFSHAISLSIKPFLKISQAMGLTSADLAKVLKEAMSDAFGDEAPKYAREFLALSTEKAEREGERKEKELIEEFNEEFAATSGSTSGSVSRGAASQEAGPSSETTTEDRQSPPVRRNSSGDYISNSEGEGGVSQSGPSADTDTLDTGKKGGSGEWTGAESENEEQGPGGASQNGANSPMSLDTVITDMGKPGNFISPAPQQAPIERMTIAELSAIRLKEAGGFIHSHLGNEPYGFIELRYQNIEELGDLCTMLEDQEIREELKALHSDGRAQVILVTKNRDMSNATRELFRRLYRLLGQLGILIVPIADLDRFEIENPIAETAGGMPPDGVSSDTPKTNENVGLSTHNPQRPAPDFVPRASASGGSVMSSELGVMSEIASDVSRLTTHNSQLLTSQPLTPNLEPRQSASGDSGTDAHPAWEATVWSAVNEIGIDNVRDMSYISFAERLSERLGITLRSADIRMSDINEHHMEKYIPSPLSVFFSVTPSQYKGFAELPNVTRSYLEKMGIHGPGIYMNRASASYFSENTNKILLFSACAQYHAGRSGDIDEELYRYSGYYSWPVILETLRFCEGVGERVNLSLPDDIDRPEHIAVTFNTLSAIAQKGKILDPDSLTIALAKGDEKRIEPEDKIAIEVSVVDAAEKDLQELFAFRAMWFSGSVVGGTNPEFDPERFRAELIAIICGERPGAVVIARSKGEIIGYAVSLSVGGPLEHVGEVAESAVHSAYRRSGEIGRRLFRDDNRYIARELFARALDGLKRWPVITEVFIDDHSRRASSSKLARDYFGFQYDKGMYVLKLDRTGDASRAREPAPDERQSTSGVSPNGPSPNTPGLKEDSAARLKSKDEWDIVNSIVPGRTGKKGKPRFLTDEEIKLLVREAKNGNSAAKQAMLDAFQYLVTGRAAAYINLYPDMGLEKEDLIQVGTVGVSNNNVGGLMRAIELYDEDKGASFSTYARIWVEKEMRYCLKEEQKRRVASLDQRSVDESEDYGTLMDGVEDKRARFEDELISRLDIINFKGHLIETMNGLGVSLRNQKIILECFSGKEEEEISEEHGITVSRVSFIIRREAKRLEKIFPDIDIYGLLGMKRPLGRKTATSGSVSRGTASQEAGPSSETTTEERQSASGVADFGKKIDSPDLDGDAGSVKIGTVPIFEIASAPSVPRNDDEAMRGILAPIHDLTRAGVQTQSIRQNSQILLSESLFDLEDGEHLKGLLGEDSPIKILPPEKIRNASINRNTTKQNTVCVINKKDYDSPELWNQNHKAQNKASLLILDENLTGSRYLYLEGVAGLAKAIMDYNRDPANRDYIYKYLNLLFDKKEAISDDKLLELLLNDPSGFANYIKFKPIAPFETEELPNSYKRDVENYLIAA